MNKWLAAPVTGTGQWVGLIATIVVVMAVAPRVPGLRRIFPR